MIQLMCLAGLAANNSTLLRRLTNGMLHRADYHYRY